MAFTITETAGRASADITDGSEINDAIRALASYIANSTTAKSGVVNVVGSTTFSEQLFAADNIALNIEAGVVLSLAARIDGPAYVMSFTDGAGLTGSGTLAINGLASHALLATAAQNPVIGNIAGGAGTGAAKLAITGWKSGITVESSSTEAARGVTLINLEMTDPHSSDVLFPILVSNRPGRNGPFVEGVTIADVLIDGGQPDGNGGKTGGEFSASNGFTADQLTLQGVDGGTVERVVSLNGGENGITLAWSTRNVTVSDSTATGADGHGFNVGGGAYALDVADSSGFAPGDQVFGSRSGTHAKVAFVAPGRVWIMDAADDRFDTGESLVNAASAVATPIVEVLRTKNIAVLDSLASNNGLGIGNDLLPDGSPVLYADFYLQQADDVFVGGSTSVSRGRLLPDGSFANHYGVFAGNVSYSLGDMTYLGFGDGQVPVGRFGDVTDLPAAPATSLIEGNADIDTIFGTLMADTINGYGGDDVLDGREGDDIVTGGAGDDDINGQEGDDALYGGQGADRITGGNGDDLIAGDTGEDRLFGGAGSDTITGGDQADFIVGDDGADLIDAGDGDDIVYGGNDDDEIDGGTGADRVFAGAGNDTLRGGDGDDALFGNSGDDRIEGGTGNDRLDGSFGADILDGGDGFDLASYINALGAVTADLGDSGSNSGEAAGDIYVSIEALEGSSFADTLRGNALANQITGEGGDDTIEGGAGDDYLEGNEGNDWLVGGAGVDTLSGSNGFDVVDYASAKSAIVLDLANPAAGSGDARGDVLLTIERIIGTQFADTFLGNGQANRFEGGAGDDLLDGRGGTDLLYGGAGDDRFVGRIGGDLFDGGTGFDTADYSGAGIGLRVHLDPARQTLNRGQATGDTLVDIERVIGSANNDFLEGNDDANTLVGGAGSDRLIGMGGDDVLESGAGNDFVFGGDGDDRIFTEDGADRVEAGAGNDVIATGLGSDIAYGDGGDDYMVGEDGNDRLTGGAGADTLSGGEGDDILSGGEDDDLVFGADGNDRLNGGEGNDTLNAGNGADILNGDGGNDRLSGQAGADRINGGDGDDTIDGGGDNDILLGNAGDDTIAGGAGDDRLDGGAGADALDGGSGVDVAWYRDAGGGVSADLLFASVNTGDAAGDSYLGIENIDGSAFRDVLAGSDEANVLQGFGGDDLLIGRGGDDTLRGMDGDDRLLGGAGADLLIGNDGIDTASYANASAGVVLDLAVPGNSTGDAAGDRFLAMEQYEGSNFADLFSGTGAADVFEGLNGHDTIFGLGGNDTLSGGNGNDTIEGGVGADLIDGGAGTDTASYSGAGAGLRVYLDPAQAGLNRGEATGDTFVSIENVVGSANADFIGGDAGANALSGGAGADRLFGRGGNDTLTGGADTDRFVFEDGWGQDVVTDFDPNGEKIDLMAVTGIASIADIAISDTADGALVEFGGNSILLLDVKASQLSGEDFFF